MALGEWDVRVDSVAAPVPPIVSQVALAMAQGGRQEGPTKVWYLLGRVVQATRLLGQMAFGILGMEALLAALAAPPMAMLNYRQGPMVAVEAVEAATTMTTKKEPGVAAVEDPSGSPQKN